MENKKEGILKKFWSKLKNAWNNLGIDVENYKFTDEGFQKEIEPDLLKIFRHHRAIPQYELNSGKRFETIEKLEKQYPGLHIAGNLKGGIGMADRIRQATQLGLTLAKKE